MFGVTIPPAGQYCLPRCDNEAVNPDHGGALCEIHLDSGDSAEPVTEPDESPDSNPGDSSSQKKDTGTPASAWEDTDFTLRWWYNRFSEKLVLTDQRILMFKRGWIRESSEDYSLDEITSISLDKGMFSAKMKIQGAGINDAFRLLAEEGRDFQTAVREQKSRLESGKEPLEMSSDPGSGSGSEARSESTGSALSKYGSVKNHVIVAVLTVWWTFGLGNLAYLAYSYTQYDE